MSLELNHEDDDFLRGLWKNKNAANKYMIPSDKTLFLSEKVPYPDCVITVDETSLTDGTVCCCRVVLFPDREKRIEDANGQPAFVGAIVIINSVGALFIPISYRENHEVAIGSLGQYNLPDNVIEEYKEMKLLAIIDFAFSFLSTWCGIQEAAKKKGSKASCILLTDAEK